MDAVAQANDIDKTQLSNGHRKQRGKQLIELNECGTLMMKFVIIEKTTTSNEKSFWKSLVVLCEHVENNFMVSELNCGMENHCSRERTQR